MARSATRTPLFVFGSVALYIVLQSAWWMWLLVQKDRDVFALQQQLIAEGVEPVRAMRPPEHTLWMIGGEGAVFLVLLLFGLWLSFRTLRHELALAKQQRDFLLATSHELRTPIAGLKLHLSTLQRPDLQPAQRAQLADSSARDVERLRSLTEKILLAVRLDEVGPRLDRAPTDLAAELRKLIAGARNTYGRDHRIAAETPDTLTAGSNAEAFASIVENLLENACKYAPPGTAITVELSGTSEQVLISVRDEGPGVPVAERERIFEKFYRAGNEETRAAKGTGLGLFIVRKLVQALGGRVEHRAAAPHGSIFAATFPRR